MSVSDETPTPSLLDDAARGGDINEGGISFQAGVVMAHIPRWLAMEGFSAMIREAMFDAEAQFFVPDRHLVKEAIEVKDHPVTPSEFWVEIDQFRHVDAGSPGSYEWFTLASAGLSESLHPIRNSLRRIRDPYGFYQNDPVILDVSYRQYVERVKRLGKTEEEADFLFRRVLIQDDLVEIRNHSKGVFIQKLNTYLPYHREMPGYVIDNIYTHLGAFIQTRRAQPISRMEIEAKVREQIPEKYQPPIPPIRLFTATDATSPDLSQLHLAWKPFFGGSERIYPPPKVWDEQMLSELRETRNWILTQRNTRRIRLDGTRRLSTSVAIGFIFSAVAGFVIDMVNRSEVWATDAYADNTTPSYQLEVKETDAKSSSDHLVVSIGLPREIVADVETNLAQLGLVDSPALHIYGPQPVISAQQLNRIVWEIKILISRALSRTGAHHIDLFMAGPAPLALFLGHRLNATATIQCYEQTGTGEYVPTCRLI